MSDNIFEEAERKGTRMIATPDGAEIVQLEERISELEAELRISKRLTAEFFDAAQISPRQLDRLKALADLVPKLYDALADKTECPYWGYNPLPCDRCREDYEYCELLADAQKAMEVSK